LLSFAVVASLQTVGVILVVAMLITPASTALLLTQKMRTALIISALIGMASAFFGLVLAIIFETTPGPAMAVTATIFYLLALIFAPKKGLIFRQLNKVKLRSKILFEDTLKQSFKLHEINQLSREALKNKLGFTSATFDKQLRLLRGRKLLLEDSTGLKLTDLGITKANELVRAHRLWETYLVNELGLNSYQIHEDAENYEHLLTKELLKEMDQRLGYPSLDPHGSPIPPDESRPVLSLLSLNKSQTARLSVQQASESIRAQLWGLGLLPGMEITIMDEGEESIKIEAENKVLDISRSFAGNINVSLN
jgi:Mn-dependent DtxR family transcriptional regulator